MEALSLSHLSPEKKIIIECRKKEYDETYSYYKSLLLSLICIYIYKVGNKIFIYIDKNFMLYKH